MVAADGPERSMRTAEARRLAMDLQLHEGDRSAKDETARTHSKRRRRSLFVCVTGRGTFSTHDFGKHKVFTFIATCNLPQVDIYIILASVFSSSSIPFLYSFACRVSTVFVWLELPDLAMSMSIKLLLCLTTITSVRPFCWRQDWR